MAIMEIEMKNFRTVSPHPVLCVHVACVYGTESPRDRITIGASF